MATSTTPARHRGPLRGLRVLEIAGIGPAPFCGMLLSDLGADVLRIDRPVPVNLGLPVAPRFDVTSRGRRSVTLDLKAPGASTALSALVAKSDVLIEGLRPGVMERLGFGPDQLWKVQPRLIYGRVTGWGQEGPLAQAAGHDLNYIALSGALHAIGPASQPVPPLNLVGDYGGGAAYLALGVLAALHESRSSGQGQVVDAAMIDGAASLMAMFYGHFAAGEWADARAVNVLDGGAPWYGTYRTADERDIAIGPIEERFFQELMRRIGIDADEWPDPSDRTRWPSLRLRLEAVFATRTRAAWCEILEGSDACFAPVLSLAEAPLHPHHVARQTFVEVDGVTQPNVAPRFSRTPGAIAGAAPSPGEGGRDALRDWGFDESAEEGLRAAGLAWSAPADAD